ncbi:GntR family transcriptional regulator [Corynebacterium alimapuense]|uniref:GntR family transcriptional regulator n=1 Tax=Corynebacterium alimapuense TaxID=1576874 RepID=A0A3M8K9N3_9CORY|nr:GntR family transcriptional regulator [Corynebacterium alimapuense]RNE49846.1 GntR family transcriptional regulator [Corynebacterium alimapuense]
MSTQRRSGAPAVKTVAADLRSRLLLGHLEPGTPLGEVDVAERYAVSRPTAKAAIESLVASRLLTRQAHRTARVTTLTPDSVHDIYRTRSLIETDAVRRLAELQFAPEAAFTANAEINKLLSTSSHSSIIDPDMRLHTSLVDAINSERISLMYRLLADEIRLCMTQVQGATLLTTEHITHEHELILGHIVAGRADEAAETVRIHLSRAGQRLAGKLQT